MATSAERRGPPASSLRQADAEFLMCGLAPALRVTSGRIPDLPAPRCSYTSHLRQPPAGKHLGQLIHVKGLAPGIYVAVPNTRINLPRPQLPLTPSKVNITPKITSKKPFKVSFKVSQPPAAQTANRDSCGNSGITLWLQQPPTQPAQSIQSWSWRPNPAHQKPPAPVITRLVAQAALTADRQNWKMLGFSRLNILICVSKWQRTF